MSVISALVDNVGTGSGDYVDMRDNYLDLTPGSQSMNDIQALIDRGVEVLYEPQREPGESSAVYADYPKHIDMKDFFWLQEEAYLWEMHPPE